MPHLNLNRCLDSFILVTVIVGLGNVFVYLNALNNVRFILISMSLHSPFAIHKAERGTLNLIVY